MANERFDAGLDISGDSKEAVAWAMTISLARTAGYNNTGCIISDAPRDWIFHTYAMCLLTSNQPNRVSEYLASLKKDVPDTSA